MMTSINILPVFPETQYNFLREIEILTQTNKTVLLVKQSENGLQVSVKLDGGATRIIPKHRIIGLPKVHPIPETFFTVCCVRTIGDSVYFSLPVVGGMQSARVQKLPILIKDIPFALAEIESFYEVPIVSNLISELRIKTKPMLAWIEAGADSLNSSYVKEYFRGFYKLLGKIIHDLYEMQINNTACLEMYIFAARQLTKEDYQSIFSCIQEASMHVEKNLGICTNLDLDQKTLMSLQAEYSNVLYPLQELAQNAKQFFIGATFNSIMEKALHRHVLLDAHLIDMLHSTELPNKTDFFISEFKQSFYFWIALSRFGDLYISDLENIFKRITELIDSPNDRVKDSPLEIYDIPADLAEVSNFHKIPEVSELVDKLLVLNEQIPEWVESGSRSLNQAYQFGRAFPQFGVPLARLRDDYKLLVSNIVNSTIDMQINNTVCLERHLLAVDFFRKGNFGGARSILKKASASIAKNLSICELLSANLRSVQEQHCQIVQASELQQGEISSRLKEVNLEQWKVFIEKRYSLIQEAQARLESFSDYSTKRDLLTSQFKKSVYWLISMMSYGDFLIENLNIDIS